MSRTSEEKWGVEISVTPQTVGQALFIHAVVIPEIMAVIDRYSNDLKELEGGVEQ